MTLRTTTLIALLLTAACSGTSHTASRNAAMPPAGFSGAAQIPGATLDMIR